MKPRIAIPVPHSTDLAYSERSWPQYADPIERSGGEPVKIPHRPPRSPPSPTSSIAARESCSPAAEPFDVNPQKYGQDPEPESAPADPRREAVDEAAPPGRLQPAQALALHLLRRPVPQRLARRDPHPAPSLPCPVQPPTPVAAVAAVAHTAAIAPNSLLGSLVAAGEAPNRTASSRLPINSSHHQALAIPGDGLRISALAARRTP